MADYQRTRRDSLGQFLRSREKFIHISKPLVTITRPNGTLDTIPSPLPGDTLNLGRNKLKRELRQGGRKFWRSIPRAA